MTGHFINILVSTILQRAFNPSQMKRRRWRMTSARNVGIGSEFSKPNEQEIDKTLKVYGPI